MENNEFWSEFRTIVIAKGIKEKYADFYVSWGVQFAKSVKGVPLKRRTEDQIDRFLHNLQQSPYIEEWQVKQAVDAIKLLYNDYLNIRAEVKIPDSGPIKDEPAGMFEPEAQSLLPQVEGAFGELMEEIGNIGTTPRFCL